MQSTSAQAVERDARSKAPVATGKKTTMAGGNDEREEEDESRASNKQAQPTSKEASEHEVGEYMS